MFLWWSFVWQVEADDNMLGAEMLDGRSQVGGLIGGNVDGFD